MSELARPRVTGPTELTLTRTPSYVPVDDFHDHGAVWDVSELIFRADDTQVVARARGSEQERVVRRRERLLALESRLAKGSTRGQVRACMLACLRVLTRTVLH